MSIFAKIITVIMSVLCTLNLVSTTDYQRPEPTYDPIPVVEEVEENENSSMELQEDPAPEASVENTTADEVSSNVKEDETKTEQQAAAPAETTNKEEVNNNAGINEGNLQGAYADSTETAEPVQGDEYSDYEVLDTVDISATENDNVTLTVYSAPKTEEAATFSMNTRNAAAVTLAETGIAAYDSEGTEQNYVTAVISGEGNMEENVYRRFVDVDKYIATLQKLIGAENGLEANDVTYTIPENVDKTDLIAVDASINFYAGKDCKAGPAGTWLEITDNVRANANPADMLKYSPEAITFDGNITSISDGAFLFCEALTAIEIPATVKTIGDNAFSYCTNLTSVTFNEGLESIGARAFMHCRNLEMLSLPSTITHIGEEAFILMKADSYIFCPTYEVYDLADAAGIVTPERTVVECTVEE